ncbi:MAG: hypothetical protein WA999_12845 [Spirulinaceae cyanobacterium]
MSQLIKNTLLWRNLRKGALAFALVGLLLPAACTDTETVEEAEIEEQEEENVTAEDVTENTGDLIGQTVTVRSDVEAVGEQSFLMSDEKLFSGETILVINATGEIFTVPTDGTEVQVTGEVREFILADIEEEFADFEWNPEVYEDYEKKAVIIAESLAEAPDTDELTDNPEEYYGEVVAVQGDVEEVLSDNTFVTDDGLLVVVLETEGVLTEGEEVAMTGELKEFVVADIEKDYDLTWDLDVKEKIEAEYETKPVLVAQKVYPSAVEE